MKLFNQGEDEQEVSGGAIFGYALIAFIAVVIIVFLIFAATKLVGDSSSDNVEPNEEIEQTVETELSDE